VEMIAAQWVEKARVTAGKADRAIRVGDRGICFAIIVLAEGKTDAWATQGRPLHEAVKSGDPTAIAAALDAGADIEEQDKGSQSSFPGHS